MSVLLRNGQRGGRGKSKLRVEKVGFQRLSRKEVSWRWVKSIRKGKKQLKDQEWEIYNKRQSRGEE